MKKALHFLQVNLLILLATIAFQPAMAAMKIVTIPLHYRTADTIIPVVEPFVAKGGTLTGQQFTLLLKSTPENIAEVQKMVTSLDKAPKQMRITVRQGDNTTGGTEHRIAQTNVYSTHRKHDDEGMQQVLVEDGQQAFISVGESIPTVQVYQNNIAQTALTYDYQQVNSGYWISPRLLPDEKVRLTILRQHDSLGPGNSHRIQQERLKTETTISLSQWVNLSTMGQRTNRDHRDFIWETKGRQDSQQAIYIKVDVLSNIP